MMKKLNNNIIYTLLTVLFSLYLSGCGGSSDGGISGTGVTMGRISNFGSIIVNGVRFDVDDADFTRDDLLGASQDDYSVGEFVVIKGSIDDSGLTGTAEEVTFTNEIEGAVTVASLDGLSLEILGQKVITDKLTVLIDFDAVINLTVGNIVEVSGTKDVNGNILATSIKLKSTDFISGTSENELKGYVENLNATSKTFMISNITIDYTNATLEEFGSQDLVDGLYVEVESESMIVDNVLEADKIELEDESLELADGSEVNIKGQITRFASTTDFDVNGLVVTTDQNTEYSDGNTNDLVEGAFVELEGETNSEGVIVAESISFEDEDEELDEYEGFIDSIDVATSTVVVSGNTVIISSTTIMVDESDIEVSPLTLSDLSVNDTVEVVGITQSNGEILASKFERKEVQE